MNTIKAFLVGSPAWSRMPRPRSKPIFARYRTCCLTAVKFRICAWLLAHDVFNVGVKLPWGSNHAQVRNFTSVKQQVRYLAKMGFERGRGLRLQAGDPTRNTLMVFTKRA